jgi:two-component sensor histidine kinase
MARENGKGKAEDGVNLEDLYRLLRSEHVQAQGIVDTVPHPLLVLGQDLCVLSASRAFFETFRVSRDETLGHPLYELGNGQWDIPELRQLLDQVIPKSAAVIDDEVRHDFPGVGRRTMLLSARRLFHPDNNSTTLLLSIEDATERRRKEEERELLLGELRHRTKNLLTLVQALANQTQVEGRSGEEYRDDFLGRFAALVRAHDLTAAAGNGGDLVGLVRLTLEPYATDAAAVVIEPGPAVALAPVQVLPLGLILHEFATNAVKHGALSAPSGRVRVGWVREEAADGRHLLRLRWEERGGPPVAPPASCGFGTRLIEFAAARDLGGRAELAFAPEGLDAEITVPLG